MKKPCPRSSSKGEDGTASHESKSDAFLSSSFWWSQGCHRGRYTDHWSVNRPFPMVGIFMKESPCSQLSAEKKRSKLSHVVTELLSFKVGHSILSFSKKNLLPSQLLKDRGGQDGDQDHQTLRVPKGSCVLWARLLFWKKITPYPCLLFFYQTYFPNKYFFSWWVGIATDTLTTSNFGNIFEKYRIKLWPNLMR